MTRAVVITGASTGIGLTCALHLDRLGFEVFASVRSDEDAKALEQQASGKLTPIILDITNSESIAAATEQVTSALGDAGLAGLVNNAGIAVAGPLEFMPIAELRRQLEVNVIGQIAVTQAFLPLLRKGKGRIVNIGSVSGRMAFPILGPYCASKFALESLTSSLRMELFPWGIPVSIIAPGAIATPIWSKVVVAGDILARQLPPQTEELYGRLIASQRKRAIRSDKAGLPPELVVRQVVHALTAKNPRARYIVGRSAWMGEILRMLPDKVREGLIMWGMKIVRLGTRW